MQLLIQLILYQFINSCLYFSERFMSFQSDLQKKNQTETHCAFLSNLFHGKIAQIYINHLSEHETKKVALEKLMNKPLSNPVTFEQERP